MACNLVWFPCSFPKHNHHATLLKHNLDHVLLKLVPLVEKRNWLFNLLWHPLLGLGQSLYLHPKHGSHSTHLWLWPQLELRHHEDNSTKHDQIHLHLKDESKLCLVQLKINRNWRTRLFEFFLVGVEILGSFDGFIHICN